MGELASDLKKPRVVQVAPNGDIFVVESEADRVQILRDADGDGKAESRSVYVEGLKRPLASPLPVRQRRADAYLYRQHGQRRSLPL